jgi:hypothetical protein
MGRGTERAPRSSKFLGRRGRATTHYLQGVEGRPSRCREFLTADGRPQRPHARGQPRSMSRFDTPNLKVTCHVGGTTASMVLTPHGQYKPPGTLLPIGSHRWADKLSRHLDNDD